jgi:putative protease
MMIDDYRLGILKPTAYYQNEIKKAENRLTSFGFFEGDTTTEQQLYNSRSEVPTKEFVGIVKGYDLDQQALIIQQRNYFEPGDTLEILTPTKTIIQFKLNDIYDEENQVLDAARHPLQIIKIKLKIKVEENSIVRKMLK